MTSPFETLSSRKNPKILNLIQLQKHAERRKQNLFLIEGLKEIEKAVDAGYSFRQVFFLEEILSFPRLSALFKGNIPEQTYTVSGEVFAKIAYRESTGGVIAVAEPKLHSLAHCSPGKDPLVLVIDGIEKPGNMGAIFRSADAAGIDLVILTDPATDLYNPNTVRASLGCIFSVQSAVTSAEEAIGWLKKRGITIYCSSLQASVPYYTRDYRKGSALVMGAEATGLSETWINHSTANIIIPMAGAADSMNVSTAAAVLLFEARKQRGFGQ